MSDQLSGANIYHGADPADTCSEEFIEAAIGLFEYYCGADELSFQSFNGDYSGLIAQSNGNLVSGNIGLGCDRCRCSISLLAPSASVGHLAGEQSSAADWAGELANQLAGRLKNRLQAFGVNMQLGLPMSFAISGDANIEHSWCDTDYMQFRFVTSTGNFIVSLRMYVAPGDVWVSDEEMGASLEGSVELF